jgi:hypothetical protein
LNNHRIEKEIKLNKLKDRLVNGPYQYHHSHENPDIHKIDRQQLRELIRGTLDINDNHTVNGWIDSLVDKGILEHNPTSQRTRNGYTKPSNDTRYIIHKEKCTHPLIPSFNSTSTVLNEPSAKSNSGSNSSL